MGIHTAFNSLPTTVMVMEVVGTEIMYLLMKAEMETADCEGFGPGCEEIGCYFYH
jgi:hypothetical protein